MHQATGVVPVGAGVALAEALLLLRAHAVAVDRPIPALARDVSDGVLGIPGGDGKAPGTQRSRPDVEKRRDGSGT